LCTQSRPDPASSDLPAPPWRLSDEVAARFKALLPDKYREPRAARYDVATDFWSALGDLNDAGIDLWPVYNALARVRHGADLIALVDPHETGVAERRAFASDTRAQFRVAVDRLVALSDVEPDEAISREIRDAALAIRGTLERLDELCVFDRVTSSHAAGRQAFLGRLGLSVPTVVGATGGRPSTPWTRRDGERLLRDAAVPSSLRRDLLQPFRAARKEQRT
jgi:hypothetical protein